MSQKFCPSCEETKDLDDFGLNKSKKDGHAGHCKLCRSTYQSSWYQDNRQLHVGRVASAKKTRILFAQGQAIEYLQSHPCVDCSEGDIEVLDFDHREPALKEFGLSAMISGGLLWGTIIKEIEKCDVRCANCHRRRTGRQFGWYKARLTDCVLD